MILQQKRPAWLLIPRVDSRFLLKALIAANIFIAIYHLFSLQNGHQKTAPCIVVINTSNNGVGNPIVSKSTVDDSFNDRVTSFQRDPWETPKIDSKSYLLDAGIVATEAQQQMSTTVRPPWWSSETRGSYSIINAFVIADASVGFNDSVTLTTQGSFEFLYHAEPLCQRWDGPVSVAVYAPGEDFKVSLQLINYLRICRDPCVRRNVTWHFIFDTVYGPTLANLSYPETFLPTNPPLFNCSLTNDELVMHFKSTFKADRKLPYPINVVRNVARQQARTRYVLASDIELYPSTNVVSMFKKLLLREQDGLVPLIKKGIPHVYVLPIFEVKAGLSPPKTKAELHEMIKQGNAIFFHKWVCDSCQNFPDRDKWAELVPQNDTLDIFRSTKRLRNRNAWEPLYIGTNDEPLYDERLTWDGKRDKMSQMYEMCLRNYDVLILDNAFLVHAPGIKHIDPKDQQKRLPFIKRNNAVYNTIISKLRKKYGNNSKC